MSFRTDPLPSYEDVVSGAFLLKKSTKTEKSNEANENLSLENQKSSGFKYKKVVESEAEDGEVLEEGEVSDNSLPIKAKTNPQNRAKKNPKILENEKKNVKQAKVQKPQVSAKKSADFASNITAVKAPFVPRLVCRYFMEGVCSKGDKCTFSHSVIPNKTPEEARVKEPCKFFIAGSCMKGDSCYFSHDLSVVPCKFFHLKGECSAAARGIKCRFSHDPIDAAALEKMRLAENERIKEAQELENHHIKLDNKRDDSNVYVSITTPAILSSATKPEHFEAHEEAKTSTESPHLVEDQLLLNPFAGGDDDEY